jgi:hypothetical protein
MMYDKGSKLRGGGGNWVYNRWKTARYQAFIKSSTQQLYYYISITTPQQHNTFKTSTPNTKTIIMQFTTAAFAASMAALSSALPADTPFPRPTGNHVFRLMSIRSGSPIQYGNVQAKDGGLVINAPDQNNKTCALNGDRNTVVNNINYASFTLDETDGSVYIYTDNPPLRLYVDRSGMGQGVVRYTTGVQSIGKNQERGPFKIDADGNLVFAAGGLNGDQGFQACPGAADGSYEVWLAGESTPAGLQGCEGFIMKALKEDEPKKCLYTSAPA